MTVGKDSSEVVDFMLRFQQLRSVINDDPSGLVKRASADEALKLLCNELGSAATILSLAEKRQRKLFASPVDPKFIEAWRDYNARFASQIGDIFWSELGLIDSETFIEKQWTLNDRWEMADDDAAEDAAALESALSFALDQATDDYRDLGEGFRERIEDADSSWNRLKDEVGFDLRGVFRRRELVPFVLIPRHVAQHHGDGEKLSLLSHLQQAHDAFVLGVHFAALALMRSVLEATLKVHYRARGKDLKERIENCQGLPRGVSEMALHRIRTLANDVLHFEKGRVDLPSNLEMELLKLLNALRALIEGAPAQTGIEPMCTSYS